MNRSLLVLSLLLPGLAVGAARAQAGAEARQARLDALGPSVAEAVRARAAEMRRLGLPADAVVLRALELAAKGAEPAALLRRIDDFTVRLAVADHMLRLGGRPAPSPGEIVAGADALGSGLEPGQLRILAYDAPPAEPLTAALIVVTALLDRGVTGGDAVGVVAARLGAGAPPPHAAPMPASADGVGSAAPPLVPTGATKERGRGRNRPTPNLPVPPNSPLI